MVLSRDAERDDAAPSARGRLTRWLSGVLLVLLSFLLVEVVLEAWVQTLFSTTTVDHAANRTIEDLPPWPKQVKNAVYLILLAITALVVVISNRWRDFTTKADIAVVVLGVILALAGLTNGSDLSLTAQAGYVYLRGVIVFYAWRAARPGKKQIRWVLTPVAVLVVLNAVVALLQFLFGMNAYLLLGWNNMTWANINRAHAFMDHPNHLGHFLTIALMGLLCWFVTKEKVGWKWWLGFGFLALAMSATQSRESALGFLGAAIVIAIIRRGKYAVIAVATALVLVFSVGQVAISDENRAELERRLGGVLSALWLPSGAEDDEFCVETNPNCDKDKGIPEREVRVLYAQQGVKLFFERPVLGYGIGQFGGIAAYTADPKWYQDTRFGPEGFQLYGSNEKQVDSFWLHLLVETGLLGVVAYLTWIFFLAWPLLRSSWGDRRERWKQHRAGPTTLWGIAVIVFAGLVAVLSPSLEDPVFPALLFTVLGISWVMLSRAQQQEPVAVTSTGTAETAVSTDTDEPTARRTDDEK
ncbi:O-antigen ligase family protein [Catenuloplanes japonicus]|uniref:O-antigen ligase family protein n=1 Tax=Catenuloplanes japonicus TaxID=33876 RepID=UPI0005251A22|nr:O-antigen ligase family protein [Catenuloplanes japonicus]